MKYELETNLKLYVTFKNSPGETQFHLNYSILLEFFEPDKK